MLFAITRKDGGVSVMKLVEGGDPHAEIAKWSAVDQAEVVSVQQITEADVPTDRTFRNAWTLHNSTITHDMAKAREIHRDRLRRERAPKLSALDIEFQRALEAGSDTKAITAKKQVLRDAPNDPRIDAAQTVEDLKKVELL